MRILLITMEFPPFKGGVGNYYHNLINHCTELNFSVLVNEIRVSHVSYPVSRIANYQIIRQQFFYQLFWPKWLKLFFIVRKLIKREKYDLIWVGQVLPVGTACYLINKFYNVPYFVSTHGMDIMVPQQSVCKKKLMVKILKSAKFITANSKYTQNQLIKLGLEADKIEVIYPCSNISIKYLAYVASAATSAGEQISSFKEDQRSKVKVIQDNCGLVGKKVLLTVGRLVKRKGHDQVIEAINGLAQKYPNLVYLIIGDGPEFSYLVSRISYLGLENRVKILNNVGDEELPLYYQSADIFIMPSRDIKGDVEGFGIVYLEAAGFGLPVIAGNTGGAIEAVIDGKSGILVDSESVEEIKAAIVKLLENETYRRQLGQSGKNRMEREFNWPEESKKIIARINNSI